jgi:hypothetical protein
MLGKLLDSFKLHKGSLRLVLSLPSSLPHTRFTEEEAGTESLYNLHCSMSLNLEILDINALQ